MRCGNRFPIHQSLPGYPSRWNSESPTYHHSTPALAVREGKWKLLHFLEDDRLELYNLEDDIGETNNLAGAMPQKAEALKEKLHRWRRELGAPLPEPNPDYDPDKADQWGKNPRWEAHRKKQRQPKK